VPTPSRRIRACPTSWVSVINRNLANGVVDAVAIDPSAIRSFKLFDVGSFVTTWYPGSGSAFVLLMNRQVYDGLSDEERGWVDEASGEWLSTSGGEVYGKAAAGGIAVARESGLEIIDLGADEKARFEAAIADALGEFEASDVADGMTGGDVISLMRGD